MEEKRLVSIFKKLAVFILLLDIILIAISFFLLTQKGYSDELKDNILNYIKLHNLSEYDYNFHKIFWCPTNENSLCGLYGLEDAILLILYLIYTVISIIGFIFYLVYLSKKPICLLIYFIIVYLVVILFLKLIIEISFNYDKLSEHDLNDFGELNNDIKKMYNSYLKRVLIIKIVSVILCISPLYYIISLFVFVIFKCLKKRRNHEEVNKINSTNDTTIQNENNLK